MKRRSRGNHKQSFSGLKPAKHLKVLSFNIEGFSRVKAELLATHKADVICLQETHRDANPPSIPGMYLAVNIPSRAYGSAIFVKDKSMVVRTSIIQQTPIEILNLETEHLNITSVYKPPAEPFFWPENVITSSKTQLVIGDFNSHSTTWAYEMDDDNGERVENWANVNNLHLVYNPKDGYTFHSAPWKKWSNPDLAFVSEERASQFTRKILPAIPKSQHRPVQISIQALIEPTTTKYLPRFNFRKARWSDFTDEIEGTIDSIGPIAENYDSFTHLLWAAAKKHIPRGCRTEYIPGLTDESSKTYERYIELFNSDPFNEETINMGNQLMSSIGEERQKRWQEMIEETDFTHNSKKAWSTINKLSSVNAPPQRIAAVTPNQVARQLTQNGKPATKGSLSTKAVKAETKRLLSEGEQTLEPFTMEELQEAISSLKANKAAGLDSIPNEMLKHLGQKAKEWLLQLFNTCSESLKLPKKWKQAKVVALLKPHKDPHQAKSYRPISLLCSSFKLYERLLMSRMTPEVEKHLTPDQAGFRPGRSCCGQVLNLTQYIEDGFEQNKITGVVLVDLSAAYDTVNHRALLLKLSRMLQNSQLVRIIASLLENRRFFVEMDGRRSRWRNQRNGLPQGSVLAPLLFNVYTNDQPSFENARRFIYADDLGIAAQSDSFEEVEATLTSCLTEIGQYYKTWYLNANPSKTQICAFHLKNSEADRKLKISWDGVELENQAYPVYLGVTLDRTLSFKQHIMKTRKKTNTRNCLLRKLANSQWGAKAKTLRTSALALSYSAAEYCAPVWCRSSHSQKIDVELNQACRIITGTLRPTPVEMVHRLSGIAPPKIRRDVAAMKERRKQETDDRHPLHYHRPPTSRLKSRKSFATVSGLPASETSVSKRLSTWRNLYPNYAGFTSPVQPPTESLPPGHDLPRRDWCVLNRARTGVGRTGDNMEKWGFANQATCPCGAETQTMNHCLRECPLSTHCNTNDLQRVTTLFSNWLTFWRDKL